MMTEIENAPGARLSLADVGYEADRIYIGGRWTASASTERIEVTSPFTEEVIASVPAPTEADANASVDAARAAYEAGSWRLQPLGERIEKILALANAYEAFASSMGRVLTTEMGAVIGWTTHSQVEGSVAAMRSLAEVARDYPWEQERLDGRASLLHEPVGVVVAIPPWNVAQSAVVSKLIPALLAGCSVVVKPSPETPVDAVLLAHLIHQVGFPEGVISILPAGREIGQSLVANPKVDHVAFTGSTAAGRAVASTCGRDLRRYTLELGGKSAAIICDDADIDQVTAGLRVASFNISGQACIAQTRVLAPRSRYDEVVEALAEMASSLRLGDPLDPSTQVGPLVTEVHRERVRAYVEIGLKEGARLVTGGNEPPDGLTRGWFMKPTIFADVHNNMRIAQEEIFGPVLAVIPYDDDLDAVRIANDSMFGLSGAVWTSDAERGDAIARRVQTGMIGLNAWRPDVALPFGGVKASGVGREYDREGLNAYLETKTYYHGQR